jgi:hypothetical protein
MSLSRYCNRQTYQHQGTLFRHIGISMTCASSVLSVPMKPAFRTCTRLNMAASNPERSQHETVQALASEYLQQFRHTNNQHQIPPKGQTYQHSAPDASKSSDMSRYIAMSDTSKSWHLYCRYSEFIFRRILTQTVFVTSTALLI